MLYVTVLVLLVFNLCFCRDPDQSGLYDTNLISIGPCDNVGTNEVRYGTRISKVNRTMLCYSGWVSLAYGLTDEMNEDWDIAIRGSTGGWKKSFLTFKNKHACSDTKRLFPQWFRILNLANLTDTSCPIPKGNYTFSCTDLTNLQFERASMMIYGRYRLTINYYLKKTLIGCTTFEAELTPRAESSNAKSSQSSSALLSSNRQDPATGEDFRES